VKRRDACAEQDWVNVEPDAVDINAMSSGSLIAWAILREGSAEWVRRDIETLLSPYRK
jgi:hypothetical protein